MTFFLGSQGTTGNPFSRILNVAPKTDLPGILSSRGHCPHDRRAQHVHKRKHSLKKSEENRENRVDLRGGERKKKKKR